MPIKEIYHERQARQLCALHTLNNLFQAKEAFTKEQLDEICNSLSPNVWINPHRSILGLGNYDVQVIMSALQTRGCEAKWFDKRKDPSCVKLDVVMGFILNVPSDYNLGIITLPLRRRHWIAVRKIDGKYYNLDSKLHTPDCIGNEDALIAYLRSRLNTNDCELFVIMDSKFSEKWLKTENNLEHTSTNNINGNCTN